MDISPFSAEAVANAVSILQSGGVVIHATETCYGLACDLRNPDAVTKLFAIKQRPESQPVSALFTSIKEAKQYVEWNDRAEKLAQEYLPGPLTIILPMRPDAPHKLYPSQLSISHSQFSILNSQFFTLGVRVSSHPHAQALAAAFGSPLSTTSANVHGQSNPYGAQDILMQLPNYGTLPDLMLDSGILPPVPPSTVIDCTTDALEKKRSGGLNI